MPPLWGAREALRFGRRVSEADKGDSVLTAANGKTTGTSERYCDEAAIENGIGSLHRYAPDVLVADGSAGA